jgi:uncharacterized damage-inducible protein DinB
MKKVLLTIFALSSFTMMAQQSKETPTLKSILLEQLKTTHNEKDWFVPVNIAIEGLTPEQANWTDGSGNHSIAQLTSHLIFWNNQVLAKFKGENPEAFNGNNDETFKPYSKQEWDEAVKKIDVILTEWEKLVQQSDENKLKDWYSTIAHIGTHNAYHTGQIIYIRKQQGSWEADKGVK